MAAPWFHGLPQHALIEEKYRVHGLVLHGFGHVALHGQMRQKRFDLGLGRHTNLAAAHTVKTVKTDEANDAVQIGPFGVNRVVMTTNILPDFIEYFGLV